MKLPISLTTIRFAPGKLALTTRDSRRHQRIYQLSGIESRPAHGAVPGTWRETISRRADDEVDAPSDDLLRDMLEAFSMSNKISNWNLRCRS